MKRRKWILTAASLLCALSLCGVGLWAADEIALDCSLLVSKDYLEVERKPGTIDISMAGDSISDIVQAFTVTDTNLVTIAAGVSTYGVFWFRNVTTNVDRYINIGYSPDAGTNFYPFIKLLSQEVATGRLSPNVLLYAHAVSNTVNLRTIVIED